MKTCLFPAVAAALLLASCDSDVSEPEPPATDLPVPQSAPDVPATDTPAEE